MAHENDQITPESLPVPAGRINNFWYDRSSADTVIVFLHGIFSTSRSCWLYEDSKTGQKVFWPDLVRRDSERLGHPSIYLAGYQTAADAGDFPLEQCAREVFEALERPDPDGTPPALHMPVLVFICHSTGGIVARYMIERYQHVFRDKAVGLALIASPSLGSRWANLAGSMARYYNQQLGLQLRVNDRTVKEFNGRFRDLVFQRRVPRLFGMEAAENRMILREKIPRPVRWLFPPRMKIVTTLSAGQFFGDAKVLPGVDHFSSVKPDSLAHPAHEFLVTFVQQFRQFLEAPPPTSGLKGEVNQRAAQGGGFSPTEEPELETLVGALLGNAVQNTKERRDRFPDDLQRNVLDFYIEARGSTEPLAADAARSRGPVLWDLLQASLKRARPAIVLADFGMGKTWFLEMAQYRLATSAEPRAIKAGETWIPLLVKLRDFRYERPSAVSGLMGLLGTTPKTAFEHLRDQAFKSAFGELGLEKHRTLLLRMFEEGRFLFLLDGLDEISIASREDANAVLTEIGQIGSHVRRSPIVVTCRRSFFYDPAQEKSLGDRGFDVLYLWPWAREDFLSYLEKAHAAGVLKQPPHDALAKIESIHDLRDIRGRALLCAMIVDQFDEILAKVVVDVPSLYERYIEKGILNWLAGKARQLQSLEIQRFMEELAFLMFSLNSLTVSPADLDEYFAEKFQEFGVARFSPVAESLVRDIKTNSFLTRADSEFTFCHTSLWEFLVARKLARDLVGGDRSGLGVLGRSAQYRSIHNNFLVPMLTKQHRLDLLLGGLTEGLKD